MGHSPALWHGGDFFLRGHLASWEQFRGSSGLWGHVLLRTAEGSSPRDKPAARSSLGAVHLWVDVSLPHHLRQTQIELAEVMPSTFLRQFRHSLVQKRRKAVIPYFHNKKNKE